MTNSGKPKSILPVDWTPTGRLNLSPDDHAWLNKSDDARQWIHDTVCSLVDNVGFVFVWGEVSALAPGVTFQLRVAKEDLGKVIGRNGRTARMLRALLGMRTKKDLVVYALDIAEFTSIDSLPRGEIKFRTYNDSSTAEKEENHG